MNDCSSIFYLRRRLSTEGEADRSSIDNTTYTHMYCIELGPLESDEAVPKRGSLGY
jgi:hypothetical protein